MESIYNFKGDNVKITEGIAKKILNILILIMLIYASFGCIIIKNYLMAFMCIFLFIIYFIKTFKK